MLHATNAHVHMHKRQQWSWLFGGRRGGNAATAVAESMAVNRVALNKAT